MSRATNDHHNRSLGGEKNLTYSENTGPDCDGFFIILCANLSHTSHTSNMHFLQTVNIREVIISCSVQSPYMAHHKAKQRNLCTQGAYNLYFNCGKDNVGIGGMGEVIYVSIVP